MQHPVGVHAPHVDVVGKIELHRALAHCVGPSEVTEQRQLALLVRLCCSVDLPRRQQAILQVLPEENIEALAEASGHLQVQCRRLQAGSTRLAAAHLEGTKVLIELVKGLVVV